MLKTYVNILEELDWPNVYLVSPQQFQHIEGDKTRGCYGISAVTQPAVTINRGLRGRVLKNSIYHEVLHQLFPSWRHWKVYLAAKVLARGGGDWFRKEYYGHTEDELPPRPHLLHKVRLASRRYNRKWKR